MRLDLKTYELSIGNFESSEEAFVLSSIMIYNLFLNSIFFLVDKRIGVLMTIVGCIMVKIASLINKLDEQE